MTCAAKRDAVGVNRCASPEKNKAVIGDRLLPYVCWFAGRMCSDSWALGCSMLMSRAEPTVKHFRHVCIYTTLKQPIIVHVCGRLNAEKHLS